jgi:hypothetical protein
LTFSTNQPITITNVGQYVALTYSSTYAAAYLVQVPNGPIIYQSSSVFQSVNSNSPQWFYISDLNWDVNNTNAQYSMGIMFTTPATYYYNTGNTTSGGNTDGILTSYDSNGNLVGQGSFFGATFSCCAGANIYSSITYQYYGPAGTTFTAGDDSSSTFRTSYFMPSLTFSSNVNVVLTQIQQYVTLSGGATAEVFIADTSNDDIIYQSSPFQVTGNGEGFIASPVISVPLTANVQYSAGIMFDTGVTYYYNFGTNTDGTLSSYSSNGNFNADDNFSSPTFTCCALVNMYVALTYVRA